MDKRSAFALITVAFCSVACGTTRSYPMPLASSEAPQATDPLLICATKMNYQAKRQGSDVVVRVDENTHLLYKASKEGSLVMEAHVDTSEDDPATKDRLAAAKTAGDTLFKCAQAVPTPASSGAGTPTPTLGNTTSAPASH